MQPSTWVGLEPQPFGERRNVLPFVTRVSTSSRSPSISRVMLSKDMSISCHEYEGSRETETISSSRRIASAPRLKEDRQLVFTNSAMGHYAWRVPASLPRSYFSLTCLYRVGVIDPVRAPRRGLA
jgi:hypothetical protein